MSAQSSSAANTNGKSWAEDRCVSDADAEKIACHMVDKLVARLSDENTVNALMSVWTGQFDQHVGRSIRRGFWTIIAAVGVFVALRFDAIVTWLKR